MPLNGQHAPCVSGPNRRMLCLLIACASPLAIIPLVELLAVAPHGTHALLNLELLIVPAWLVAVLVLLAFPIAVWVRRWRRLAIRAALLSAVLLAAGYVALGWGMQIRTAAFEDLAGQSAPLVQAIRAYEARHGAPPPALESLVPEFLPAVPHTGMAAYPHYEYKVGTDGATFEGNPWVLYVPTPTAGISFDRFMYYPLQNYPVQHADGWLEPIGEWVYLHE